MRIKLHFHINGFALSFALKQRFGLLLWLRDVNARIYNSNQTINLYSLNQLTLEHIHVTFEEKGT